MHAKNPKWYNEHRKGIQARDSPAMQYQGGILANPVFQEFFVGFVDRKNDRKERYNQ